MTKEEFKEFIETSEAAKEVWNAAIEAAALRVEDTMLHKLVAYEIRKLKK